MSRKSCKTCIVEKSFGFCYFYDDERRAFGPIYSFSFFRWPPSHFSFPLSRLLVATSNDRDSSAPCIKRRFWGIIILPSLSSSPHHHRHCLCHHLRHHHHHRHQ